MTSNIKYTSNELFWHCIAFLLIGIGIGIFIGGLIGGILP